MKPFIVTLCLVVVCIAARAQDTPTLSIPVMLDRAHIVRNDTARLDLLLNIANAYIIKQRDGKTNLDSVLLLVGQVKTANDQQSHDPRISGLCDLLSAKAWKAKGDQHQGKQYALQAVDIFKKQNDDLNWAYAVAHLAGYYDYNDHDQDSIRCNLYRAAIPVFDRFGRTDQQARFRELLGECMMDISSTAETLPVLLESMKLYRSMGHSDLRNVYTLLGTCYAEIGDVQQAIDYEFKALRLEEARTPPEPSIITTYGRLASTYYTAGQFESAIDMFKKGYALAIQLKRDNDAAYMGSNLAISLTRVHRAQEALDTFKRIDARYGLGKNEPFQTTKTYVIIYLLLHQRNQLIKYGEALAVLLDKEPPMSRARTYALNSMTMYALAMKQFDRARKYDLELMDASRHFASLSGLVSCYIMFYRIDSVRGDQVAALRDYRKYIEVRDSSKDITHARQIAGLQVEYDVEKKNDSIRSLTQSQLLSQAALHQTSIARNATVAAAILLLILLGVAINRYRLKQRSNRQLQLQKAEIDSQNMQLQGLVNEKEQLLVIKDWLMKELNHRMGNNLHFMMSLQNMQAHNLTSQEALNAIMQSNNRLYAMSLIHKKLYQPDSEGTVNMVQYIGELVQHLSEALSPGNYIALETHVADIELDVSQAIPVGLILNEAITNAYKYAFKDISGGATITSNGSPALASNGAATPRIDISLKTIGETELEVVVKDNGIGYTPTSEQGRRSSLGFLLMEMLTTQLRGTLTILNEEGLCIRLRFPGQFREDIL